MAREATSPVGVPRLRIFLSGQARPGCWDFDFKDSLRICCWLETILILPLPFFTTPSPLLLSVQHSYRCTPCSCRLTHITQDTLHTQPRPTSHTPKTISFEPLKQFRQLHRGWIHLAATAPLLLGPPTLAACSPNSCPRGGTLQGGFLCLPAFSEDQNQPQILFPNLFPPTYLQKSPVLSP